MRVKDIVCLLVTLFFLFGFISEAAALSTSGISFRGAGVIIDLTFPEEAHPTETITHNLTITAYTALTLENFTLVIKALVDSSWQQVYKYQILSQNMLQDERLSMEMVFTLPQNAHERLYCYIYVLTSRNAGEPFYYMFYTTYVRTLTYDELVSKYNELVVNYSSLLSDYEILLETYNNLSDQYHTLNSTYNSLLSEYNALQADYGSLNSTYYSLQASYDSLLSSYNSLEASYNSLNQTYNALENEINDLRQRNDASTIEMNNTRNLMYLFIGATIALIALIIYIKKKKPEPYIVLRKETVALKPTDD